MKIFLDANILLDVILERRPFYAASTGVISECFYRNIEMVSNSLCYSNAHYIARKAIGNVELLKSKIVELNKVIPVVVMNQEQMNSSFKQLGADFEDNLHIACAENNNCTHILTRDKNDFIESNLIISNPKNFLISLQ